MLKKLTYILVCFWSCVCRANILLCSNKSKLNFLSRNGYRARRRKGQILFTCNHHQDRQKKTFEYVNFGFWRRYLTNYHCITRCSINKILLKTFLFIQKNESRSFNKFSSIWKWIRVVFWWLDIYWIFCIFSLISRFSTYLHVEEGYNVIDWIKS